MASIHRIATEHHCQALVAFDSFGLIAARILRIATPGRTVAIAHRYATYTGQPAELHHGLTVAHPEVNEERHSMWVSCTDPADRFGGMGFGIGIRDEWKASSEEKAWEHYHAGRHEADRFDDRRRDLTWVRITGGRLRDDPDRRDEIVIRTYNRDGVCDERVVSFGS